MSKDESRAYLCQMIYNADENEIVATNGKALIKVKHTFFEFEEKGRYSISILDNKTILLDKEIIGFPIYNKIIPEQKNMAFKGMFYDNVNKTRNLEELGKFLATINIAFNLDFLMNMPISKSGYEFFTVKKENYKSMTTLFKGSIDLGEVTVVVMPISPHNTRIPTFKDIFLMLYRNFPAYDEEAKLKEVFKLDGIDVCFGDRIKLKETHIEILNDDGVIEFFWIGSITKFECVRNTITIKHEQGVTTEFLQIIK
jgi:hypothetical protein